MKDIDQTNVTVHTRRYLIQKSRIQRIGFEVCSFLGVAHLDLAVQFVGDTTMRRLNNEFRGKDKTTDVLSFPQVTWQKPCKVEAVAGRSRQKKMSRQSLSPELYPRDPLGDIVISLPMAERNARRIGQSLDREVCFLLVHGILHLCGHDHMYPEEEKTMLRCQKILMRRLGEDNPKTAPWRGCAQSVKRK